MNRRLLCLCAIWIVPSALFVTLTYAVQAHFHIAPRAPLSDEARIEVVRALRESLAMRAPAKPEHPELSRRLPGGGPVSVAVWLNGRERARAWGRGERLADALFDASEQLIASKTLRPLLRKTTLARSFIKVDIAVGQGPLVTSIKLMRALGLHPGLEGLGVRVRSPAVAGPGTGPDSEPGTGARELLLLPEDLIGHRLLIGEKPLSFVPDFRIGLDFGRADKRLASMAKKTLKLDKEQYRAADKHYYRFRTESFVAPAGIMPGPDQIAPDTPPVPLLRGFGPPPPVTADRLRAAAIAGGRYLVAHLAENGRYVYERNLFTGRGSNPKGKGAYSIPRHAGTTYFLAELYRLTGETFLREPIERAFSHLSELIAASGCEGQLDGGAEFACVVDKGRTQAHLGASALTVVALVEYRRATGDGRYDEMARRLAEWILYMQRADGSFTHIYDVKSRHKLEHKQLLYYSGEAALALARMHAVYGDDRYRDAAERALDHIVGWYDFFMGGFFFGEEHWTCIAAEAIYPAVKKSSYVDFCHDFAAFLRTQQSTSAELPGQPYMAGAYNITPFLVPMNTPAGSKTESMISAYLLGRAQGRPDSAVRGQITAALEFLLGQQIRQDHAYFVPKQVRAVGAVPGSPVDWKVRIDYVQHVCSAMIRAVELIESEQR